MRDLFLGLDVGTTGARAIVIDEAGEVRAKAQAPIPGGEPERSAPNIWWCAARQAVLDALSAVEAKSVRTLAVDGTSGTVLALDSAGHPLGNALMYNDSCDDAGVLGRIAATAPAGSAAIGASSALARGMRLTSRQPAHIAHQADWISRFFSGQLVSDENNALKTGYDLAEGGWPDWIAGIGFDPRLLPPVVEPGIAIGSITHEAARVFGLSHEVQVVAGTTDGCASFLATGANRPGDGVTALGTTMTIKLLCEESVSAPEFGIYSHRILGHWLAGGASNTGGNVLLKYFGTDRLAELSASIDPECDCKLDYYPLSKPGERFPVADDALEPRLEPRPDDDVEFLKGLLDGIARIEALAYSRLCELGAPKLGSVRTVGGGAVNATWTRLRERRLDVPMFAPSSAEAAYGTALLARRGAS